MLGRKYRFSYLPLFYDDLDEKVSYIAEKLGNPKAANDLLNKVETAILENVNILTIEYRWIILPYTML